MHIVGLHLAQIPRPAQRGRALALPASLAHGHGGGEIGKAGKGLAIGAEVTAIVTAPEFQNIIIGQIAVPLVTSLPQIVENRGKGLVMHALFKMRVAVAPQGHRDAVGAVLDRARAIAHFSHLVEKVVQRLVKGKIVHAGKEFEQRQQKRHAAIGNREDIIAIADGNTVFSPGKTSPAPARACLQGLQFGPAAGGGDTILAEKEPPAVIQKIIQRRTSISAGGTGDDVDQMTQLEQRRIAMPRPAPANQKLRQGAQHAGGVFLLPGKGRRLGQAAKISQKLAIGAAA